MIDDTLRTAVSSAFDDMTEDQEECPGRMLIEPTPGGLNAFLVGCLESSCGDKAKTSFLSVEAIEQVFVAKQWDLQMSFQKDDIFALLDALIDLQPEVDVADTIPALTSELQAAASANGSDNSEPSTVGKRQHAEKHEADFVEEEVVVEIQHRFATGIFPVLRPDHIADLDSRKSAADLVMLTVPQNQIKLQAFIETSMQEFLRKSGEQPVNPLRGKQMSWVLNCYYLTVREFLITETLETHTFAHRVCNNVFVPLLCPHSVSDESKKKLTFEALAKMNSHLIEVFDKALWDEWQDVKQVSTTTGEDIRTLFSNFLNQDYFSVLRQTCDSQKSSNMRSVDAQTLRFQPMVAPDFDVSADQASVRQALLTAASVEDHNYAVAAVTSAYNKHVETCSASQKKFLPREATPKFASLLYYGLLQERLDGADASKSSAHSSLRHAEPAHPTPPAGASSSRAGMTSASSRGEAMKALLSGRGFAAYDKPAPTPVQYKSAASISNSSTDGGRCHLQAVVVVCEDYPRTVQLSSENSRKRKSSEGKAADVILADNTGPIGATLWGDAAEEICTAWRKAREGSSEGQNPAPLIVDLQMLRISVTYKTNWNGVMLTHMTTLSTMAGAGPIPATSMNVIKTATESNLLNMTYQVPPEENCVTKFHDLRGKLQAPFRLTVKGRVADLQGVEFSQSGSAKRTFDLVDSNGLYISCCAMHHNAESAALEEKQEVVLYYGTGRGPIGSSRGMLYLMKSAMIISLGKASIFSKEKTEHLTIE